MPRQATVRYFNGWGPEMAALCSLRECPTLYWDDTMKTSVFCQDTAFLIALEVVEKLKPTPFSRHQRVEVCAYPSGKVIGRFFGEAPLVNTIPPSWIKSRT